MDTAADRNFPYDQDSVSVFRKAIGHEFSDSFSNNLYSRYRMNFLSNVVQNEAPKFVYLGLPVVNTSTEFGILGTPATTIRRLKDGSYWSASDHVFGEATSVGMSATRSDQEYSYKTDFEIWRENKDFGRKCF